MTASKVIRLKIKRVQGGIDRSKTFWNVKVNRTFEILVCSLNVFHSLAVNEKKQKTKRKFLTSTSPVASAHTTGVADLVMGRKPTIP